MEISFHPVLLAHPTKNKGSRFIGGDLWPTIKVLLPRVDEPVVPEQAPEPVVVARGTETILLVEDQPQLRQLTSHILRGYGYRVLAAANGEEALHICEQKENLVDLVLTDIVMPGVTGIELVKRLRTFGPHMKILYMSGYTDDVVLRQGALEPGAAYLEKPFTPEGLATKIRQILGMPAADQKLTA